MIIRSNRQFPPSSKNQPDYASSTEKQTAIKQNIDYYRYKTGRHSIPDDKGYWTLCNVQEDVNNDEAVSEINQVLSSGLIKSKSQFFGVDYDTSFIEQNEKTHPEAYWINEYWHNAIINDFFDPAFIYFDTLNWITTQKMIKDVVQTMLRCSTGTMLFVNLMSNDPCSQKAFCMDDFIEPMQRGMGHHFFKWSRDSAAYDYSATRKTVMSTIALLKKED